MPVNWEYPRFNVHIAKKVLAGSFTPGYVQHRPVHRGASSRDVVRVGRDAAPASVVQHKPRPQAALGIPPRGTRDRGPVRLAVKGKAVDAAWRVERTRAHPMMRQGPGDPGPPVRSGRSGEIQAMRLLGAPLPSLGRRKRDGLSRARPK